MQFQKILVPVGGVVLLVVAYRAYGWGGVAFAAGALVMWILLHFNRVLTVLRRAANRPIGFVDSAVMLNAKLTPGVNLLHVMALTRSVGEQLSAPDAQPEVYRWTDASDSSVTCELLHGKLVRWELKRPVAADDAGTTRPGLPPAP